jgi:hypothetical protein
VSCRDGGCADQSCDDPVVCNAGVCRTLNHQRRRHRLDDRCDCAGADDDGTGSGAVLFRHGAQEERAGDNGAKPCSRGHYFNSLGRVRLFAGIRRRRPLAWHARSLVSRRHDHGRRQSGGEDDRGKPVHALPDDVRDHHRGAGGRLGRRSNAVLGLSAVFHRLVHVRLRSARPLGLGRRFPRHHGRTGFCRRPRSASQCRGRRPGGGKSNGPAPRAMAPKICRRSICRSP